MATTLRMPVREPLTDDDGMVQRAWRLFFRTQNDTVSLASVNVGAVSKLLQAASIAATPVPMTVNVGYYRISVYARRTQAATTSSDLKVDVGWTESGATLTATTGTDSTNTTTKVLTGSWVVRADQTTTITYATTYASVGATPMQYRLDVLVEQVKV